MTEWTPLTPALIATLAKQQRGSGSLPAMPALRPYQEIGAKFLAERHVALLADSMGIGKSAQAIRACDMVGAQVVLVICPASVCETWRREFLKFSPRSRELRVLSYEKATRGDIEWLLDVVGEVDVLVLDEAHMLKGATSKRARHILGFEIDEHDRLQFAGNGLVSKAKKVILLTGTPMPNHPGELWPMLRALAPETILNPSSGKPYSYWQFVKKFCKTVDSGYGDPQIVGGKNHDDLRQRLQPFMLRRLKSEVLKELPPIQFEPLYVEGRIPQECQAEEWAAREILDKEGLDGLARHAGHVATLRRLTGLAKVAPCVEWIRDFIESGRKLVVFAYHREVMDGLLGAFASYGNPFVAYVHGGTAGGYRTEAIDRFQNEPGCKIFIGQIQAAGTGITLTAASDVLFVESDWVPANVQQAAARVHRIGQSEPCMVRFATLAGSLDEDIERALVRKMSDVEKIIG